MAGGRVALRTWITASYLGWDEQEYLLEEEDWRVSRRVSCESGKQQREREEIHVCGTGHDIEEFRSCDV
jgi:hypothetical protein